MLPQLTHALWIRQDIGSHADTRATLATKVIIRLPKRKESGEGMGAKTQYIHKNITGNNETDIRVVAGVGGLCNILY